MKMGAQKLNTTGFKRILIIKGRGNADDAFGKFRRGGGPAEEGEVIRFLLLLPRQVVKFSSR
jgi:hypothetical protein